MKKLFAILLCFIMLFSFVGCKDDELLEDEEVLFDITSSNTESSSLPSDTSSDETDSSETEGGASEGEDASQEETSSVDASAQPENEDKLDTGMNLVQLEGIYFPDLNETYKYASEIYRDIVNSTFSYDEDLGVYEIVKDGSVGYYWRVNDERFDSVEELEAYLDAFFTDECQKTFYDPSRFIDHNGHLYAVVGVTATDPTYAGCSFTLTKQTTRRIYFDCTGYYYKTYEEIDTSKPHFTTAPEDASKYNTRTVSFVLQSTEDGNNWQFTQFGLV